MTLHVVIGPPAAGKSTFVADRASRGALRIDFDALANALTGLAPDNHEHGPEVIAVTKAARRAAVTKAVELADRHEVWIIHSTPAESTIEKYRSAGATIHEVDPGKEVVMSRIKRERSSRMLKVAAVYYDRKAGKTGKPTARRQTTTQRGYGYKHQKMREYLIKTLVEGTVCWWCGEPMFSSQELDADHSDAEAKARGGMADRLLHASCNRSRKKGARDDERPAVLKSRAAEQQPVEESVATGTAPAAVFDWPTL